MFCLPMQRTGKIWVRFGQPAESTVHIVSVLLLLQDKGTATHLKPVCLCVILPFVEHYIDFVSFLHRTDLVLDSLRGNSSI